jgi:hypothetical protein
MVEKGMERAGSVRYRRIMSDFGNAGARNAFEFMGGAGKMPSSKGEKFRKTSDVFFKRDSVHGYDKSGVSRIRGNGSASSFYARNSAAKADNHNFN